jgi:hypothetical protein
VEVHRRLLPVQWSVLLRASSGRIDQQR